VDHPVDGCLGPSRIDIGKETDTDVEIVEEGKEGETLGPVPAAVKGQLNLTLATYRIGCLRMIEAELDKYVDQGLLKPTLCGLCHARSLMRPSSFMIFCIGIEVSL